MSGLVGRLLRGTRDVGVMSCAMSAGGRAARVADGERRRAPLAG
jgi:hypothetical protein